MSHPKCFRYLARLALSLALIVAASPAWAWGDLGHRVICQMAFQGTQREDPERSQPIDCCGIGSSGILGERSESGDCITEMKPTHGAIAARAC